MTKSQRRLSGELVGWNEDRGFGFIRPNDGGADVFAHVHAFIDTTRRPALGDRVTFRTEQAPDGRIRATEVAPRDRRVPVSARKARRGGRLVGALVAILLVVAFIALAALIDTLWPVPTWIPYSYAVVSVMTAIFYALDKAAARRGEWRISESTLHVLALIGGWPGAFLAQALLRHKSTKLTFRIGFWMTVVANLLLFVAVCVVLAAATSG